MTNLPWGYWLFSLPDQGSPRGGSPTAARIHLAAWGIYPPGCLGYPPLTSATRRDQLKAAAQGGATHRQGKTYVMHDPPRK